MMETFPMGYEGALRRPADHRGRWPAAVASLTVGAAFLALWCWLLPPWLGFHREAAGVPHWRWLAAIPSALGFAVALRCIWDFGWTGRGTPAPIVPPKRLVAVGFYRYVRNPMYVGFFAGWLGLWIIFGRATTGAITGAVIFVLCVVLLVLLYEEPTLGRMFGADYEEYCRNVRRWIPRMRPWTQGKVITNV
jgi:protein-S-isoprenylcysteine O-methyltransferase Ste14